MAAPPQTPGLTRHQGSLILLTAAFLVSILLHGVLAALCLMVPRQPMEKEQSLFVQLISHRILAQRESEPKPEPERARAREANGKPALQRAAEQGDREETEHRLRLGSKAPATPVLEPVRDSATRKALKRIQKKIMPLWSRADPPGIGQVEVRMELDAQGAISSLWITSLQGPPELGDFIARIIRRASPFPEASRHLPGGSLVLDCAFDVTGSSMETVPSGAGEG